IAVLLKRFLTLLCSNVSVRNRFSNTAIQKLLKQKPAPLTVKGNLALIEAGNLEDDLERLADVDWIIEVVVENLDIKTESQSKKIKLRAGEKLKRDEA
ncbi:3-hydroxyacyl-CoA dehydrogenase NAD-binding domain-containing protein, partial [Bacillus sp. D-CC]